MSEFGRFIEMSRNQKGLSKSELARRLSITPQYMADIEKGRMIPSEEKIEKLVKTLELNEKEAFKLADKLPLRVLAEAKQHYYKHGS
ncbi:helix-turn-helix transcriptional regulator [Fictibacillus nanhaiensis]|uniref:helix-turn-helix domain-containing protein n=1 Tax=Fictibacillus nanhaiensis TaxID=742169 RepID=UPI002E249D99|nr:helix-turn-helix transcriptional regulator [Fictibacillus nanhaiensis]